jgi:hypothetical protein
MQGIKAFFIYRAPPCCSAVRVRRWLAAARRHGAVCNVAWCATKRWLPASGWRFLQKGGAASSLAYVLEAKPKPRQRRFCQNKYALQKVLRKVRVCSICRRCTCNLATRNGCKSIDEKGCVKLADTTLLPFQHHLS